MTKRIQLDSIRRTKFNMCNSIENLLPRVKREREHNLFLTIQHEMFAYSNISSDTLLNYIMKQQKRRHKKNQTHSRTRKKRMNIEECICARSALYNLKVK